jgi:hypothetical protein
MKRISWLVIGISIFATVIPTIVFIYYYHYYSLISSSIQKVDKFGIKKIYPTIEGGREWFVDMDNPFVDNLFYSTSHRNITRQDDGSWRIGGSAVRLNVITPSGAKLWKNIEITGYAKIVGTISSSAKNNSNNINDGEDEEENQNNTKDLSWRGRGGRHNSKNPCEGTALIGTIDIDGNVRWKKEIWHTGGYTDARAADNVTDSILDRWIGWKVVMYNIYNDTAVKMESYIDDKNNNNWTKVTDVIDNGGWYARSADNIFYSANCGRPKDYIITNGGSIVTFRADGIVWDFKNLSVREIQSPDM